MITWHFQLPTVFFLLYGRDYKGRVKTERRNRSDARVAVKKLFETHRYPMDRVPEGTYLELVPVEDWKLYSKAKAIGKRLLPDRDDAIDSLPYLFTKTGRMCSDIPNPVRNACLSNPK